MSGTMLGTKDIKMNTTESLTLKFSVVGFK